jgi:ketosteroid isomerase-like protein
MTSWILILLLCSCALAQDSRVLLERDREFGRVTAAKGFEGFLSFFAPEGVSLPAKGPALTGPEQMRKQNAKTWSQPGFSLRWTPMKAEMARSGDMGYTWGTYEASVTGKDGRPEVQTGKYVTIWRKQPNGEWKVILDMGN